MSLNVTRFEQTPNPNAVKCILDSRIVPEGEAPRSYRDESSAKDDDLAQALFDLKPKGSVTSVLMNDDWITVNKAPDVDWQGLKRQVERIVAERT